MAGSGPIILPGGAAVRGRRLAQPAGVADFTLVLAGGGAARGWRRRRHDDPAWPYRRIRWPDFWVPLDRAEALQALREAHRRAYAGERVEIACRGGVGRTGTALAALAVLDRLSPEEAVRWVRRSYHPRAVETPWQRRWLRHVAASVEPV